MKNNRFFWLVIVLIFIGSLAWSLTMVKSGWNYAYGLGFWGANGHDGVWHIALINSLAKEFPSGLWKGFGMPVFAGEPLKNYHIGFDLMVALTNKLTNLPVSFLYFQVFPPVFAVLIGLLTYKFVLSWRNSKKEALWAVFFTYFGGSFGWLVSLFRNQGLGGESMFWSQQAISTLINPPYALSLIICLAGLIRLIKYFKKPTAYNLLLTTILFGLLIEIKAYAGILIMGGLFASGVYQIIREKKYGVFLLFLGSSFLSFLLYFPNLRNSSGLLVFQPFWYLETMMGLSDRVGWTKFYSAMTNYRMGGIWLKAVLAYSAAFVIFLVGNLGTRAISIVSLFHCFIAGKNRKVGLFVLIDIIIFTIIIIGIGIPMFFLQKGTPWNTIQFFYYPLFFLGILSGVWLGSFIEKTKLSATTIYIIVVVLVVFTIPTTIGTLKDVYLPNRPPAMLTSAELEALNFLKNQPVGIVLTYPYDKYKAKEAEANPPRPLYLYESTAYVSAFSHKPVYLEDEVNLDITGYTWPERRQKVLDFLNTLDQVQAQKFLKDNNVSYIYWVKPQRAKLGESQLGMSKIYENGEIDIFQVR
jgi:hypothetical protein